MIKLKCQTKATKMYYPWLAFSQYLSNYNNYYCFSVQQRAQKSSYETIKKGPTRLNYPS